MIEIINSLNKQIDLMNCTVHTLDIFQTHHMLENKLSLIWGIIDVIAKYDNH
jgi:hypothetical protein